MKKRAPVTQELLDWLTDTYPDRIPSEVPSEAEMARLVGQQQVIRKLRSELEKQYTP